MVVASLFWGRAALAQTVDVPPGQSQTQGATALTDGVTPNTLTVIGGGTFVLNNTSNTYSGGTVVAGSSSLQLDSDSELGSTSGGITLGDAATSGTLLFVNTSALSSARTVTLNAGGGVISSNGNGVTLSGVISGPGGLTLDGGLLYLTGVNTYTGATTVTGGTSILNINANTALGGSSGVTLDGGTLQFGGSTTISQIVTLTANGGTIDSNGTTSVISNGIVGAGGLTVVGTGGAGTLVLDGVNTYTGTTTVNSGTLEIGATGYSSASLYSSGSPGTVTVNGGTLAGAGLIYGVVNNSGVVAPDGGAVGALTVVGSYTQGPTGILSIRINPSGASALNVTGTASLGGTLNLAYGTGGLHPGTYQIVSATGGLSGTTFNSVTGSVPSAVLVQSVQYTPTAVDLVLTQIAALPDPPTIFPAVTSAAIDDGQQFNQVVLSRLQDSRTGAMADNLDMARFYKHRDSGRSAYGVWVQPTGDMASATGGSAAPGYTTSSYGLEGGVDGQLAPGVVGGVAAGFSRIQVEESGGATGTIDAPHVAAYGGWWRGPFAVDGLMTYGAPGFTIDRPVAGVGETAKSSHPGTEFSAATQASMTFNVHGWVLSPALGAKYMNLAEAAFSESGTNIYNFTTDKTTTNSLRSFADATVSHHLWLSNHTVIIPELRVGYEDEMMSVNRQLNVQTEGDAATWAVVGAPASRGTVNATARLDIETARNDTFYIDYGRTQGSNSSSNAFTAGFFYRL